MATNDTKAKTETAEVKVAPPISQVDQPPVGQIGGAQASSLSDLQRLFHSPSCLSEAGKVAKARLTELLGNFKVESLAFPTFEAILVSSGGHGIVVMFQETYHNFGTQVRPMTDYISRDIMPRLGGKKNMQLEITVVLKPEDYSRIETLAHMLSALLDTEKRNMLAGITTGACQNATMNIDMDINTVRSFVDSRSPHAVREPADFGFVFSWANRNQGMQFGNNEIPFEPLFACTGTTRFIANVTPEGVKYQPIVILTNVTTDYPGLPIMAMALPIAAYVFICAGQWQSPYGFTKGDMNLGNLILDESTKKPMVLESVNDMQKMSSAFFLKPVMAIDVTEGRFRIPGVESMASDDIHLNHIHHAIRSFLQPAMLKSDELSVPEDSKVSPLVAGKWGSYTGIGVLNGAPSDTREAHFLRMIQETGDYTRCLPLLQINNTPDGEFNNAASMMSDARPLYGTETFILNSNYLEEVAKILQRARILPSQLPNVDGDHQFGNSLISNLVASNAGEYGGLGRAMTPSGGYGWTPWGRQ